MGKNLFSEDLAFSVAKFASFKRGKEYFEDGLVEKIWKDRDTYKAKVRGSELYMIELRFDEKEFKYSCSCPYDFGGA